MKIFEFFRRVASETAGWEVFERNARLGQIKVQVTKEPHENSRPIDSYWLMAKPGAAVQGFVGMIIENN